MVFPDHAGDFNIRYTETFADDIALYLLFRFPEITGDGLFKCIATHHRAMHFFLRQATQILSDVFVGYFSRLL